MSFVGGALRYGWYVITSRNEKGGCPPSGVPILASQREATVTLWVEEELGEGNDVGLAQAITNSIPMPPIASDSRPASTLMVRIVRGSRVHYRTATSRAERLLRVVGSVDGSAV